MRAPRAALAAVTVGLATAAILAHRAHARTARVERDLGALQACLLGGPVAPPETVQSRLEALSASLNLPEGPDVSELEASWPDSCQPKADVLSQSLRTGVPSSPAARGQALLAALTTPVARQLACPFRTEPSVSTDPEFPLRAEAVCESGTQVLRAWWTKVEAAARVAGFVVRDEASFDRPRVRRPALRAPFPDPVSGPLSTLVWSSRAGAGRGEREGNAVFRTFAPGQPQIVLPPSWDARRVLGAEDDAPSLLWRKGWYDGAVVDERGIEVWPDGVRAFGAFATRAGAHVVICAWKKGCRLIERTLRGDAYVTVREQALPGSEVAQIHGGVLVTQDRQPGELRLGTPGDPFAGPSGMRSFGRTYAIDGLRTCRYAKRTTVFFPGEGGPWLAVHDGQAWSAPVLLNLEHGAGYGSFSCDATGASFVDVDYDRRVCATRCVGDSCTRRCSAPVSPKWSQASWVGIGDHVFGVGAGTSVATAYIAKNSVWYRFGTVHDLGDVTLLCAGQLHHGWFGGDALAWPSEDGALISLLGPDTLPRFARVDGKGELSFVAPR